MFGLLIFALFEMVFITLKEIHNEKGFNTFMEWSKFLKTVDEVLDVEEAKQKFANRKHPYVALTDFITGLVILVMSFNVAPSFAPMSLLGTVSLASFVFSCYSLGVIHQRYFFTALSLQITATLCESFDSLGMVDLANIPFKTLVVHITISNVIRIASVVLYIFHIRKQKGPASMVGRSVVLVSIWWEVLTLFCTVVSLVSLIKYATMICATLVYLPFAAVIFVYYFSCYIAPIITQDNLVVLTLVSLPAAAYLYWSYCKEKLCKSKYGLAAVQIILSLKTVVTQLSHQIKDLLKNPRFYVVILTLVVLNGAFFIKPSGLQIDDSKLSFDDFHQLCLDDKKHSRNNAAHSSVLCNRFKDHYVNWEGTVKEIELEEVENRARAFCNQLPSSLATPLTCMFGERYPDNAGDCTSLECLTALHSKKPCHLEFYDRYSFKITVSMTARNAQQSSTLNLTTGFGFGKRLIDVKPGTSIGFYGVLNPLEESVSLEQLTLKNCEDNCLIKNEMQMYYSEIIGSSHQALVKFFLKPFFVVT